MSGLSETSRRAIEGREGGPGRRTRSSRVSFAGGSGHGVAAGAEAGKHPHPPTESTRMARRVGA